MPGAERRAKLPPDPVVAKPPAALAQNLLCRKGAANAVGFRPPDWSYERRSEPAAPAATPVAHPAAATPSVAASAQDAPERDPTPRPRLTEVATDEHDAAKQALAADLAGMIETVLETTQFAAAATRRTRSWTPEAGEAKAPEVASPDTTITASSLAAELGRARPAPVVVQPATSRRWIDVVLVLACVVMVMSAEYFAITL